MLVKIQVTILYCQCHADFVSASLFNQLIMFTVTQIIALWTFLSSFIEIVFKL